MGVGVGVGVSWDRSVHASPVRLENQSIAVAAAFAVVGVLRVRDRVRHLDQQGGEEAGLLEGHTRHPSGDRRSAPLVLRRGPPPGGRPQGGGRLHLWVEGGSRDRSPLDWWGIHGCR